MQTSNHPLSMDQTAATSGNISRGAERCCISNLRNLSMKPLGPGKHSWKVLQTTWNMWLERPPGRWCFSSQTLGRYLPAVPRNCYICQLLLPGFPGFPDESLWITGEVVSNCRHSICSSGFTKNHSNNKKSRRMTCSPEFPPDHRPELPSFTLEPHFDDGRCTLESTVEPATRPKMILGSTKCYSSLDWFKGKSGNHGFHH